MMDTASLSDTATASSLRVFIVDDVTSARAGLNALLSLTPQIAVIGQAEDGTQALAQIPAALPDVVVMDIAMPGMDGLEVTRRLRAAQFKAHIVILSVASNCRAEALAAGADAFVHKGESLNHLIQILESYRPTSALPELQAENAPVNLLLTNAQDTGAGCDAISPQHVCTAENEGGNGSLHSDAVSPAAPLELLP